jgi:alternative ribosome-rescue factor
MKHEHGRGKITDNAIAALVTSPMFKAKQFKSKKGKGSYTRKNMNKVVDM